VSAIWMRIRAGCFSGWTILRTDFGGPVAVLDFHLSFLFTCTKIPLFKSFVHINPFWNTSLVHRLWIRGQKNW
jgi:hypothetical protein